MLLRTALISVMACGSLLLIACDSEEQESHTEDVTQLPSRSSCIVGYHLLWEGDGQSVPDVINEITVHLPAELLSLRPVGVALRDDGTKLYMIFGANCEDRYIMSQQVIDYWQQTIPKFPQSRVIEGTILPSVNTIDVSGVHWRD